MNGSGTTVISRLVLPVLVLTITLFVGSTFKSLETGLGAILLIVTCLVIPGFLIKSRRSRQATVRDNGRRHLRIDSAESLRRPRFDQRVRGRNGTGRQTEPKLRKDDSAMSERHLGSVHYGDVQVRVRGHLLRRVLGLEDRIESQF